MSYTEVVMLAIQSTNILSLDSGKRLSTAIFAGVFGALLLYLVAFAHSDILHNSTHDTRHASVVPCQ
jgi:cobalt transporter subunit CbtB